MNTEKKFTDDQEIDLAALKRKMNSAVGNFNSALFRMVQFVFRNAIILGILLVVGVALGFVMDKKFRTYDHQIVVAPNFGSYDYLYAKVDLIESKIKEGDTVFLKSIGIQEPKKLLKIEIRPIVDAYPFVARSEQNFELLKLMAEDGDIKKIVEEPVTSKNYPYHLLSFVTKGKTSPEKTVAPLMAYLNNSRFYADIQQEYVKNIRAKMAANEQTIEQINKVFDAMGQGSAGNKTSNLVYINENTQLNDVIETKDKLVRDLGNQRIELVSLDKIVKDVNVLINSRNTDAANGKMKFILPLLFVFVFMVIKWFIGFYRRESLKAQSA